MARVVPPHRRDPDDSHDSQYYRRGVDDIRNVITSTTEPLGAEPGTLWYNPEGVPDYGVDIGISKDDADELYTSKDEFAAVADVPDQVAAVEAVTDRLDTLTYDVERFIPASATRADAWQAAIDTAHAAGGGTVTSSQRGTHVLAKGLRLRDGVYIDGQGSASTVLDVSAIPAADRVGGCGIYGEGSMVRIADLSTPAAADTFTLTFTSAPSLSPGDTLLIENPADYSFSPYRAEYHDGEFARVLSVNGVTVETTTRRFSTYPASVHVYKVTPIRTGLRGVQVKGGTGFRSVKIKLGASVQISDYVGTGSNISNLEFSRCYGLSFSNVRCTDYAPASGYNYGITIANSQDIYANHLYSETTRHGFVTGGDAEPGAIPNRNINLTNSYVNSTSTLAGLNFHGNVDGATLTNVIMPNGFNPAGDNITVRGGRIESSRLGQVVASAELLGANLTFENVHFKATQGHPGGQGFIYITWTKTGLPRQNQAIRFTDCLYDWGPYARNLESSALTSIGVYIYSHASGDLSPDTDVFIRGGEVRSTFVPDDNPTYGFMIRADAGRAFRHVAVTGVDTRWGVVMQGASPKTLDFSHTTVRDAPYIGIQTLWGSTPFNTNCTIYLNGTRVLGAYWAGMQLWGSSALDTDIYLDNVTSIDSNEKGTSTSTNASMYLYRFRNVYRRNCTIGDTRASTKQTRLDYIADVTSFTDMDTTVLGTVTARTLTNIDAHHYRGRGTGAPTLACADGSTYLRTDGGAGATLYVREGGDWVTK